MAGKIEDIIDKLNNASDASDEELKLLLLDDSEATRVYLRDKADLKRRSIYGNEVFIRGLIEFTNYCKNNCYYCGIRRDNKSLSRYRLDIADMLECADRAYDAGCRTFVFQGGEDLHFADDDLCRLISEIKKKYPDTAVTLSIGERSYDSYKRYYETGADRYLLRHETYDEMHYKKLHPDEMSWANRIKCLYDLKEIGYAVGSGFMVGSPFQTVENIICDIRFLQKLKPAMIGIGPYICHKDTPFASYRNGSLEMTIKVISILRLMFPGALIPATTALGTLADDGRILGIKSGANVIMPNVSPLDKRHLYSLYDNKIETGAETVEGLDILKKQLSEAGYEIVVDVGNPKCR